MSSRLPRSLSCLACALLFAAALIFSAQEALAQQSRQTRVLGRVLDPNHAAIAGATIKAEASGRAAHSSAITNQKGEFSLSLAPGEYALQVVAAGFAKASQTVRIQEGNSESVEIVLQVGPSSATVTISDRVGFQTERVAALPVPRRRFVIFRSR
jgi:uncharacterized membrane protein